MLMEALHVLELRQGPSTRSACCELRSTVLSQRPAPRTVCVHAHHGTRAVPPHSQCAPAVAALRTLGHSMACAHDQTCMDCHHNFWCAIYRPTSFGSMWQVARRHASPSSIKRQALLTGCATRLTHFNAVSTTSASPVDRAPPHRACASPQSSQSPTRGNNNSGCLCLRAAVPGLHLEHGERHGERQALRASWRASPNLIAFW